MEFILIAYIKYIQVSFNFMFYTHGEKKFAVLPNRIVDVEPTNFFAAPTKY